MSNTVEQMNNLFCSERKLPTVELLDAIWTQYMETRSMHYGISERFQNADNMKHINGLPLTPFGFKLLIKSKDMARYNSVKLGDREKMEGRVVQNDGRIFIVNISERHSFCLQFFEYNLSCGHAIALIYKLGIAIPKVIIQSYWVGLYQCSYYRNVNPIDIKKLEPEPVPAPPPPAGTPGRPAKKRRERGLSRAKLTKRARAEMDGMLGQYIAQGQKQSCKQCGAAGHNSRSCKRS
ncbi:MAG: hypothetical protein M1829_002659 [Trizodia sp. TS-e1964]|nr:MAG: hypothetical protein M1829_002659 [Trizodia sp. TS-e1964]